MIGRMKHEELDPRLAAIFRAVLDLPGDAKVEALGRSSCPEWDSLRHVKLMLEVQREFGVRFGGGDILRLDSFSEIRRALAHD
jgi:acyl carrier protein